MSVSSVLGILFEALKLYRRAHFDRGVGSYTNGMLYKIALEQPKDVEALLTITGDASVYRETGPEILEALRLFAPTRAEDDLNSRTRSQLEKIEVKLYDLVVKELKRKYRENWWFGGVPEQIRVKAAQLHEESEGAITKESALYLVDLKEIVRVHWSDFKDRLADPQESKKSFDSRFGYLLDLRNRLSHPVRLKDQPIEKEEMEKLTQWLKLLEEDR